MTSPRKLPKVHVEEEEFKFFFNPLTPKNSKLLIDHLIMAGNIPPRQPPQQPPPKIFNKAAARYAPLNLPRNLHNFPDNYLKLFPKFNGEDEVTTLEHLSIFDYFTDNQGLEHEDVYMKIFVQTFEGEDMV